MLRHMNEIDLAEENPIEVRYDKKTYQQVIVGELEKRVELREYNPEPTPLLVTDLSLASIIASGNMELLRPVGQITDTLLQAHDKVNNYAERIDNFATNNIVEPQIENNDGNI